MKVSSTRLAGALLMGTLALTVVAGTKTSLPVSILTTTAKPFAAGDLGYVRNTADATQYIGCEFTDTIGVCFARDVNGVTASCTTTDPVKLEVIHSIHGDGSLMFAWNTDGTCRLVKVTLDSRVAPK